jgi:hypothetical protein
MKKYITTIYHLLFLVVGLACRKEIKEPPENTRNSNFVYLEIDGEKFMVEDRSWNFNKNTRGTFAVDGSKIYTRFINDSIIEVGFNAQTSNNENNRKYRILSIGMNLRIQKNIGFTNVYEVGLNGKCYTEIENVFYSYSINKYNSGTNISIENISFQECKFYILKYDESEQTIELNIQGKVENDRDNKKLVPIYIHILLKNNSQF